jgi:hypothetical protein
MKNVYWTFTQKEFGGAIELGVCFDSDYEGISRGDDYCGSFPTVLEAVQSAYHDGLSAPHKIEDTAILALGDGERIRRIAERISRELAQMESASLVLPLAEDEG